MRNDPESDCICTDSLVSCPTNCLVRWSQAAIPATWHAPPVPATPSRTADPEQIGF